jgi:hypothetical protein
VTKKETESSEREQSQRKKKGNKNESEGESSVSSGGITHNFHSVLTIERRNGGPRPNANSNI